ncbi:hypothetical protein LIER_32798 [Lithospermum erythrorhizon]|uniref:Uncharacterized protein n=1 Tax=Lithospermum erythrorhizon TaxID=34254 RepID=A0AAV3RY97_LITER
MNNIIFEGHKGELGPIWEEGHNLAEAFLEAQKIDPIGTVIGQTTTDIARRKWTKPEEGAIKINVDATFLKETIEWGLSGRCIHSVTPLVAECLAARIGIEFAWSNN